MATAPAHVEDRLHDAWLEFAEDNPCDKSELPLQDNLQPADAITGSASADGGTQQVSLPVIDGKTRAKKKKPIKIAMEAMIRGFEKHTDDAEEPATPEECHHKVAAWHNVPHP